MGVLNPYTAGNPIGQADAFFGREGVLRQVRQLVRNPRESAIVLFGQRRIGKTSILLQLERELERTGVATAVYFDLQDKASKPLADVLYELAQRIGAKTGVEVPSPDTFDPSGAYFRETFLPTAAASVQNGGLVLLFDEFDVLDSAVDRRAGQTFFPYLRTWMDPSQRARFVFVIGRRPEDLSIETVSAFKGVRSARVSLLEEDASKAVIRQSERDGLPWSDDAVNEVWALTRGHAYLTQLLCSVVWERAMELDTDGSQPIDAGVVRGCVDDALQQGAHAFRWIWDGLPPAERVVIAAMAEAPGPIITHDELIEILNRSGVRLIVRQLELAPDTLVEWELLRPEADGKAFAFTVALFRRWVATHRPLRRVKDELDRLDPLAEGLFQTGNQFYGLRENAKAETQLREALRLNPNHLKSRLLLGRLLLETDRADDCVTVLEEAYAYDSSAARADLIRALLAAAEGKSEEQQIALYSRVLAIDPAQPLGRERLQQVRTAKRQRELALALETGEEYELAESWSAANDLYRGLLNEYPDHEDVLARYSRVQRQTVLADRYNEAIRALDNSQPLAAQELLAQVIHTAPGYKEAARHLLRATTGIDVAALTIELNTVRSDIDGLRKAVLERDAIVRAARKEVDSLRHELAMARAASGKVGDKLAVTESSGPRAAAAQSSHRSLVSRLLSPAEPASPPLPAGPEAGRQRIITTLALAKQGQTVTCPICSKRMTREQLIQHASSAHQGV